MAMKRYFTLTKSPELEPRHQKPVRTPTMFLKEEVGVLPLFRRYNQHILSLADRTYWKYWEPCEETTVLYIYKQWWRTILGLMVIVVRNRCGDSSWNACPVGWSSKIHRQQLCWKVRPPSKVCPGYNTKQSDGEVSVLLELWGMRNTPSLSSLPGPLVCLECKASSMNESMELFFTAKIIPEASFLIGCTLFQVAVMFSTHARLLLLGYCFLNTNCKRYLQQ